MRQTFRIPAYFPLQLPDLSSVAPESEVVFIFRKISAPVSLFLNDRPIFHATNFFREYTLKLMANEVSNATLSASFESLKNYTQSQSILHPTPMDENGFSYTHGYRYPMIRQPAYACGWDWCHPIEPREGMGEFEMSFSVQQPIASCYTSCIEALNLKVNHFYIDYDWMDDFLQVNVKPFIQLEVYESGEYNLELSLNQTLEVSQKLILNQGENELYLDSFILENPTLWWPHSLGTPYLYDCKLVISKDEQSLELNQKVGFKKIEMTTSQENPHLGFKINDKPFSVYGSNLIPTHQSLLDENFEAYQSLVIHAKNANMNTLRIWGGGDYAHEDFYALCDEHGILVWQDYPFACNLYPEHPEMKNEVEIEVSQQLQRIRKHVSLMCLCGNNEVHSAYYEWLRDAKIPYFYGHYYFHELLPRLTSQYAPHIPYWPGSPYDSIHSTTPSSMSAGDRHAWQCYFGDEPAKEDFRYLANDTSMFISEFGFIAPPFYQSIPIENRSFEYLDALSNYGIPLSRLRTYIAQVYHEVSDELNLFCLQGLRAQALMIQYAVDAWRQRGIQGVLLWHYNDLGVAPSWGMMDGAMRARPALYVLRKLFAPIYLAINSSKDHRFKVDICSDTQLDSRATLEVQHYIDGALTDATHLKPHSVVTARLVLNGETLAQNVWSPSLPRENPPSSVLFSFEVVAISTKKYEIYITSLQPVSLGIPTLEACDFAYTFIPSAIDLIPNVTQKIELTIESDCTENLIRIIQNKLHLFV